MRFGLSLYGAKVFRMYTRMYVKRRVVDLKIGEIRRNAVQGSLTTNTLPLRARGRRLEQRVRPIWAVQGGTTQATHCSQAHV